MSIILANRVHGLRTTLADYRRNGESIGFVPTMGALHKGHLSLVDRSAEMGDHTVCSIFVNPTQFNEERDLETYPRTLEKDLFKLLDTDTDVVFVPEEKEVYPEDRTHKVRFDFDGLADRMEGAHRPGHFEGVVQVVHRLLEIIQPDYLVLGQKDYQQWVIIRKMAEELHPGLEVLLGRTVREEDGLALSSRNKRLTEEMRSRAPTIYQSLKWIEEHLDSSTPRELVQHAKEQIEEAGLKPEYVELVDGYDLLPIRKVSEHELIVACAAAWAEEVRLIDNVICKGNPC